MLLVTAGRLAVTALLYNWITYNIVLKFVLNILKHFVVVSKLVLENIVPSLTLEYLKVGGYDKKNKWYQELAQTFLTPFVMKALLVIKVLLKWLEMLK